MDCAVVFCTLAADSGWNRSVLIDAFLHGLSPQSVDLLIALENPENLDEVRALTNKID